MGKSCGECGMCCKLLAIQSLDKPAGAWCGHFKRAAGCGVYEERPPACRGFVCLWLDSEKLDEAWRPDRAKFLMYTEKNGQRLNVIVDPAQPGAWKREPYYRRIKAMSCTVAPPPEKPVQSALDRRDRRVDGAANRLCAESGARLRPKTVYQSGRVGLDRLYRWAGDPLLSGAAAGAGGGGDYRGVFVSQAYRPPSAVRMRYR